MRTVKLIKRDALIAGSVSVGLGILFGVGSYLLQGRGTASMALVVVFAAMGAIAGWVFTSLILKNVALAKGGQLRNASVEVHWLRRAWSGALLDLVIVSALGAIAFSFGGAEAPITSVLASVVAFGLLDASVRFVFIARGES